MSAWIVSKTHIDLMVKAVRVGTSDRGIPPQTMTDAEADELGQRLVTENVASVRARYPNDKPGDEPGPGDGYYLKPYRYTDPMYTPTLAELARLVSCYEYQSCEHRRWEKSIAHRLCKDVMEVIKETSLAARAYFDAGRKTRAGWPEYEAAPWGWDEDDVQQRLATVTG